MLPKFLRRRGLRRKPRLFVDMDGTLCEWRQVDTEELYKEGYFERLRPQQGVIDAVNKINSDGIFDVYILTHYLGDSPTAQREKAVWKDKYLPHVNIIYVKCGSNKAEAVERIFGKKITRDDILLDDYTENLRAWKEAGGTALKLLNDVNNTNGTWEGLRIHMDECKAVLQTAIEMA